MTQCFECCRCGQQPCGCGHSLYCGDVLDVLAALSEQSVHCVVTSPPYWALRDYGVAGQIGLENTPEQYVAKMVEVFRGVWRVLRDEGTLWLNLGDSYSSSGSGSGDGGRSTGLEGGLKTQAAARHGHKRRIPEYLKPKDLCGIPWRVAFALHADGWYLRSDIIWSKPNPMPESITDRPTKAHEYLFLLSKQPRYFYDAEAIREPVKPSSGKIRCPNYSHHAGVRLGAPTIQYGRIVGANKRSVWTVPSHPFPQAHFATFPPALIEPCILAGTSDEGCCPECGAPWVRAVEKRRVRTRPGDNTKIAGTSELEHGNRDPGRHITATTTTGWQPGCNCSRDTTYGCGAGPGDEGRVYKPFKPIPCTVLDPFIGSGTTSVVAQANGRRSIGIDLNSKYLDMAVPRLTQPTLF